jgi:hypothetical protein
LQRKLKAVRLAACGLFPPTEALGIALCGLAAASSEVVAAAEDAVCACGV